MIITKLHSYGVKVRVLQHPEGNGDPDLQHPVVGTVITQVQTLPRVPTWQRRLSRAVRPRQCRTPREHGPVAARPEPPRIPLPPMPYVNDY